MLVLSRRENERIRLGDTIELTVIRVSGDRVRLGITAPASLRVVRSELPLFDPPDRLPAAG